MINHTDSASTGSISSASSYTASTASGKTVHQYTIYYQYIDFYLHDVVSGVFATATWLAGWLGVCVSQPVLYQND